jgi:tRNA-splicing ligase RtcB (3'-phosphate/5'-hydroxy nucleic acid ligase)
MYVLYEENMKVPVKIWAEENTIEQEAINQIKNAARLPFVFKHLALMPDVHSGYGIPIGSVVPTNGVIVPFFVGVDIGCGMTAIKSDINFNIGSTVADYRESVLKEWLSKIRECIPVGFNHSSKPNENEIFKSMPDIPILKQELNSAKHQLGTLGGGNHFIEIQQDEEGYLWVMIHSGSRNLGKKVADIYHKKAKSLCDEWFSKLPNTDLSFLPIETQDAKEYYEAMNFCLQFAFTNRSLMLGLVMLIIGVERFPEPAINIHHNYATWENHFGKNVLIHRKGATLAREGTIGIIPGSMGTNSYIVEGLGNPESFNSCSHGAGRRLGRKEAQRTLILEEEQAKMDGIIGAPRTQNELEEAPGAYKDVEEVMENQKDLVKIVHKLKPLAVIKG